MSLSDQMPAPGYRTPPVAPYPGWEPPSPRKRRTLPVIAVAVIVAVVAILGVVIGTSLQSKSESPTRSIANPAATSSSLVEQLYLTEVRLKSPSDAASLTDGYLIGAGQAICSDFIGGNDLSQTISDAHQTALSSNGRMSLGTSEQIVFAGVRTFCPQYRHDLPFAER